MAFGLLMVAVLLIACLSPFVGVWIAYTLKWEGIDVALTAIITTILGSFISIGLVLIYTFGG